MMRTELNRRGSVVEMLQEGLNELATARPEHFGGMYKICATQLTVVASMTKDGSTLNKCEAFHVAEAVAHSYMEHRGGDQRRYEWALTPWQCMQLALYIDSRT